MNNEEIIKAIDAISEEKGLNKKFIFDSLKEALRIAYRKNFNSLTNVKVVIDEDTLDIKVYSYLTVVSDDKEDFNKDEEIKLSDALKINEDIKEGETIDTEVTPKDFGRVSAATAKQVLMQKLKEAERMSISEEFTGKEDEIVVGKVELEDERNYYIDLGRVKGILPKNSCIPGEIIKMGEQLKCYLQKIDDTGRSLNIILSRSNYRFVIRLFEEEVPEIADGIIEIHGVAREAGNRSKIAVSSNDPNIDPVGTCIGNKGARINNIVRELNGEKIDIVKYDNDPETFISNALLPAENLHVVLFSSEENKNEAYVFADEDNSALAIGKGGINIRLASRLTKYHLNIKSLDEAGELGINFR